MVVCEPAIRDVATIQYVSIDEMELDLHVEPEVIPHSCGKTSTNHNPLLADAFLLINFTCMYHCLAKSFQFYLHIYVFV